MSYVPSGYCFTMASSPFARITAERITLGFFSAFFGTSIGSNGASAFRPKRLTDARPVALPAFAFFAVMRRLDSATTLSLTGDFRLLYSNNVNQLILFFKFLARYHSCPTSRGTATPRWLCLHKSNAAFYRQSHHTIRFVRVLERPKHRVNLSGHVIQDTY